MEWRTLSTEQPEDEYPIIVRLFIDFDYPYSYLYRESVLNLRGTFVAIKFEDKLIVNTICNHLKSDVKIYDIDTLTKDTMWAYIGE